MRIARLIVYMLLVIGTIGLLVNEISAHGGTTAALVFAALNTLGLIIIFVLLDSIGGKSRAHR